MFDALHPATGPRPVSGQQDEHFSDWLRVQALPLWADRGWSDDTGFTERLDFGGNALDPGFKRLRLVARQSAVYSQARMFGLGDYKEIADKGWRWLLKHGWVPGQGWVARMDAHGQSIDDRFDLYDQAFGLFALACRMEATGDLSLIPMALEAMALIDKRLRCSDQPGWLSQDGSAQRDQNPHMHYLEALLRLRLTAPLAQVDDRIAEICDLALNRFFDGECGAIAEFFAADWRADPHRPRRFEPGHQFEWFTLLSQAEAQGFGPFPLRNQLFTFADTFGFDARVGLFVDGCDQTGQMSDGRFRLWPQCEAIRAMALAKSSAVTDDRLQNLLGKMHKIFIPAHLNGGWCDHIDEQMTPIVDYMPASSLYHLLESWSILTSRRDREGRAIC